MTRPRIGISVNLMHADPERALYRNKALHYVEARMTASVWRAGGLPVVVPALEEDGAAEAFVRELDGLILSGGADVSPQNYGELPLKPVWGGDPTRDAYEIGLVHHALAFGLPMLGLCRGLQLLNVALGGSLWQDLQTQREDTLEHRNWHRYDDTGHAVSVAPASWVGRIYGGRTELHVNSVHHQGIRRLAPGLEVSAQAPDGVIEAIEWIDAQRWIVGLQWHPEWLEHTRVSTDGVAYGWADGSRVFEAFLDVAAQHRARALTPSDQATPHPPTT